MGVLTAWSVAADMIGPRGPPTANASGVILGPNSIDHPVSLSQGAVAASSIFLCSADKFRAQRRGRGAARPTSHSFPRRTGLS